MRCHLTMWCLNLLTSLVATTLRRLSRPYLPSDRTNSHLEKIQALRKTLIWQKRKCKVLVYSSCDEVSWNSQRAGFAEISWHCVTSFFTGLEPPNVVVKLNAQLTQFQYESFKLDVTFPYFLAWHHCGFPGASTYLYNHPNDGLYALENNSVPTLVGASPGPIPWKSAINLLESPNLTNQ